MKYTVFYKDDDGAVQQGSLESTSRWLAVYDAIKAFSIYYSQILAIF
jgi:hypothetical protein